MDFLSRLQNTAYIDSTFINTFPPDLDGWMCGSFERVFRNSLQTLYEQLKRPLIIIEVGSWKGLSATSMARIAKECNIEVRILCIDTWLGAPEFWTWGLDDPTRGISLLCKNGYPQVYYTFLRNVIEKGHQDVIIPFPISSNEACEVLTYHNIHADIIYVDAAHEYGAVKNDMKQYWNILNNNGIMLGDDYTLYWSGVIKAVDEFCIERNVVRELDEVVWRIKKPSESLPDAISILPSS
jgi:predicted O-methyltransferase YrrM